MTEKSKVRGKSRWEKLGRFILLIYCLGHIAYIVLRLEDRMWESDYINSTIDTESLLRESVFTINQYDSFSVELDDPIIAELVSTRPFFLYRNEGIFNEDIVIAQESPDGTWRLTTTIASGEWKVRRIGGFLGFTDVSVKISSQDIGWIYTNKVNTIYFHVRWIVCLALIVFFGIGYHTIFIRKEPTS